jgi:flap endonuclease-1
MGIKQLNHFLIENCTQKAIYKMNLRQMENNTIVIDTSIYLYKFAEKGAVAENIYLMISVFRQYNIVPVFVFDGKPPAEKKALLIKRKIEKDAAEAKYNELKATCDIETKTDEMERLKKQFVRVTESDIEKAKQIMRAYGVQYIEARGESDHLCAFLVKHGFAWACLSDDMDMFLYGCPRVIRHLSLLNHEGVLYDTAQILIDLDMDQAVFNDIAILSGTDYNIVGGKSLSDTVRLYMRYREWTHMNRWLQKKPFCEWLNDDMNYIQDLDSLKRIRNMFDLCSYLEKNREEIKCVVDLMPFQVGEVDVEGLKTVLFEDGFIFC